MKFNVTIAATLIATFCLAQSITIIEGAYGKGRAESRDGRIAEFDFEVARRQDATGVITVGGRSLFAQVANRAGRAVRIEMKPLNITTVVNTTKVAEFGGNAVLVVQPERAGGEPHRVEGRAYVRVEDNTGPVTGPVEHPDVYRIHFQAAKGDLVFDFLGAVRNGNLSVKPK